MTDSITALEVHGCPLIDSADFKVGTVRQLYVNGQTDEPEWVTVKTGFFGTIESFVPLANATYDGQCLSVPFTKYQINGAPSVSPDGDHLPPAEEEELYRYYGVTGDTSPVTDLRQPPVLATG